MKSIVRILSVALGYTLIGALMFAVAVSFVLLPGCASASGGGGDPTGPLRAMCKKTAECAPDAFAAQYLGGEAECVSKGREKVHGTACSQSELDVCSADIGKLACDGLAAPSSCGGC